MTDEYRTKWVPTMWDPKPVPVRRQDRTFYLLIALLTLAILILLIAQPN